MANSALVSVGLPTYNRPDLLKRALSSVCEQSYKNLEIIIGDNASTDPAVQGVIAEFSAQDPRITTVLHPVNGGPFFNFKTLLQKASGRYFIWLADDDYWSETYIEKLVSHKEASGAALVYGRAVACTPLGPGETLKYMESQSSPASAVVSFLKFDSDSIFYGLFDTSNGKKLAALLQPWGIPKPLSKGRDFIEYNFNSYCFIYGLLARGGFFNVTDESCVHYVDARELKYSSGSIGYGHVALLLCYVILHWKMASRFLRAGALMKSGVGCTFAPFAAGFLFVRRIYLILLLRRRRARQN
jgi:GalNAc5-diNAcBac-PP-undecaprenol beta-1,3-glucosyltransferase